MGGKDSPHGPAQIPRGFLFHYAPAQLLHSISSGSAVTQTLLKINNFLMGKISIPVFQVSGCSDGCAATHLPLGASAQLSAPEATSRGWPANCSVKALISCFVNRPNFLVCGSFFCCENSLWRSTAQPEQNEHRNLCFVQCAHLSSNKK